MKNRFYFVSGGRIRIPSDRMPQFIELNTNSNTAAFDVNFIRILLLMFFGGAKIKARDFQPDIIDLMKGKLHFLMLEKNNSNECAFFCST